MLELKEYVAGKGIAVAIDGPSGAGKSTVAKAIAASMGARFLDTGAMYRSLTWQAKQLGVDLADESALATLADELVIRFLPDPDDISTDRVLVGDVDVTVAIRADDINRAVSEVAAHPLVRAAMVRQQAKVMKAACDEGRGCVAEGRDITTVVAPWAQVRVLLTADEAVRASRRGAQSGAASAASMAARDAADSKVNNFTQAAEGVHLVDSTYLTLDETIDAVANLVRQATK